MSSKSPIGETTLFTLTENLTQTKDPKERKRLREELAVMTFCV